MLFRSISTLTQGYDADIYIMPFIQDISGHTGQDLFSFVDISRIDRQLFPTYVEQMYFDRLRLRAVIPLTPASERVYWEGEFPRTYGTRFSITPDKKTWLAEHSLPELTDEYLDKMFEVFTGYSLTEEARTRGKTSAYRTLLKNSLSFSTHPTNEDEYVTMAPFIHVPPVGVVGVMQRPDALQINVTTYLDTGTHQYTTNTLLTSISMTVTGASGTVFTGTVSTGVLNLVVPSGEYTIQVTSHTGYSVAPLGTGSTANILPPSKTVLLTVEEHTNMYFGFI